MGLVLVHPRALPDDLSSLGPLRVLWGEQPATGARAPATPASRRRTGPSGSGSWPDVSSS
jgi:hypothetical protein